eukprot:3620763-Pleurochrysis_carterae.AAC.1
MLAPPPCFHSSKTPSALAKNESKLLSLCETQQITFRRSLLSIIAHRPQTVFEGHTATVHKDSECHCNAQLLIMHTSCFRVDPRDKGCPTACNYTATPLAAETIGHGAQYFSNDATSLLSSTRRLSRELLQSVS